jgi:hypothetical protein
MDTHKYRWPTTIPSIQNSLSLRVRANEPDLVYRRYPVGYRRLRERRADLVIIDLELPCRLGSHRDEYTTMIDGQRSCNVFDGSGIRKYLETGLRGISPSSKTSARRLAVTGQQ